MAWPQVWWVVSERPVCLGDSASSSLPPGSGGAGLGFSQTSLLPRHASSAAAPAACPQWAPPTPTCSAPISPPSSDFSWSHVSVVLSPGGGEGLTESLSLTKLQPGSTEQSSQLGPDV